MEKDLKSQVFTIPNILSLIRLLLIPVFVWLYSFEEEYTAATVVLVFSAVTDIVDGWIARHFNMISDVGKIIDPIADKLTQLTVLICLVVRFPLMLIPAIFLIVKELVSGIFSLVRIKKTDVVPGAVWHGKVNTVLLYIMMLMHVIFPNISPVVSDISILVCITMMVISAVLYLTLHYKAIKSRKSKK